MFFSRTRTGTRRRSLVQFLTQTFSFTVLLPILGVTSGCNKDKPIVFTDSPTADIFSNRPIGTAPDLYLITLSSPPLLTVSTKTRTGWKVPADAKAKIQSEQDAFEAKLKTLASDAKIIFRYRLTINALAVYSSHNIDRLAAEIPGVIAVAPAMQMGRPESLNIMAPHPAPARAVNSVTFIGADQAHKRGITGRGMRVGVLDTGVDYTHSMLGGSGDKGDFAAIDPNKPSSAFPNAKVIGGIDLVGTDFNAAATQSSQHLPIPDSNPIDEAGHGTHVAGTIAGKGDGTTTYDGVAPDAKVYAIKVFGKEGSTADAIVIAGFEYSVDPNGDLNPDDQLDVINMSLGGGFGQPNALYAAAVRNLSQAGTMVVASAGNSGPTDYIVGSPSTSDEALSVAASVDGSSHNWKFGAVAFSSAGQETIYVKAVEGSVAKPIAQAGDVNGPLVDIGDASEELSAGVKAAVKGKVALIQRGKVPFATKLVRAAEAGAIGIVVYNNAPGNPIAMGGEGHVDVPAIMVTQEVGMQLLAQMQIAPVTINFKTDRFIEEPENIDTITDFSSKGPRSEDNLLKPEISAPGQNIISAEMGSGSVGVQMSGTSMAAPHMAGVIALLKQNHPSLSSVELKSLVMGTAKVLSKGMEYPITLQGAGRVQIVEALDAVVAAETPSISLGRVQLQKSKSITRNIILRNLTSSDITLNTEVQATPGMTVELPKHVSIPAGKTALVLAKFNLVLLEPEQFTFELDGRILFKQGTKTVLQIPALAIRTQASLINARVSGNSVALSNSSPNDGLALPFNLIGQVARKTKPGAAQSWKSTTCDLQSAGYRIIRKTTVVGDVDVVQFAFKVYDPVTTWVQCAVSVLIDKDGDDVADQEIAGIAGTGLEGVEKSEFTAVVLDAAKARTLRLDYEKELGNGKADAKVDYSSAVIVAGGMAPFNQSTVVVIEAPLAYLAIGADGLLHVKVASQAEGGETYQPDKFIGSKLGTWLSLPAKLEDQPYYDLESLIAVSPTGTSLNYRKGSSAGKLVVYYPLNEFTYNGQDAQQQILADLK